MRSKKDIMCYPCGTLDSQNALRFIGRMLVVVLLSLCSSISVAAPKEKAAASDTIDLSHPDENFVIASVLVISQGNEPIEVFGHACLRLQCPHHKLDYVFSANTDNISQNALSYLVGMVNVGCQAIPTAESLAAYGAEGREVKEYTLNLPIRVKQRLWQLMDEKIEEPFVPCDMVNSGCALSVFSWLQEAIGIDSMEFAPWPEKYDRTMREIIDHNIEDPWLHVTLSIIFSGKLSDTNRNVLSKVVMPTDLAEVLCSAKAFGQPLVKDKPVILFPKTIDLTYTWFTPDIAAVLLLLLSLAGLFLRKWWMHLPVLVIGMMIGCFVLGVVLVSSVEGTEWNLLMIPFFPLPLVGWRWRRYWLLPLAAICVVWSAAMLLSPHRLIDTSLVVLALTIAITYFYYYKLLKDKK